jgi:hypothetical protein
MTCCLQKEEMKATSVNSADSGISQMQIYICITYIHTLHTYIDICIHIHTHTYIHTYIHIHTHIYREALVSDLRHRPRRREVHPSFSLWHAFENMARFNQHRLCVLNADNSVIGILCQSMIIDFLVDNIDKLGPARNHPIWQLRPFTVVLSVNEQQKAIGTYIRVCIYMHAYTILYGNLGLLQ